ncbi:hypothetical protein FNF29_01095 [Cafeteria roenbergensis]|uniref:Uncharacterized protein n=1 Tax=Cafeteria roenbergensis TaxID=33653 RepID=A0A5A8CT22_CAFRO|nr:hypothetical protein FNF29_01095 [Cafeteria roenbergensis]|eukprot:KAA0156302.1 hypothetical protein FNF29_01095 [Cafeteria roenbergensis]
MLTSSMLLASVTAGPGQRGPSPSITWEDPAEPAEPEDGGRRSTGAFGGSLSWGNASWAGSAAPRALPSLDGGNGFGGSGLSGGAGRGHSARDGGAAGAGGGDPRGDEELLSKAVRLAVLREEYVTRLLRLAPPRRLRRQGWRLAGQGLSAALPLLELLRETTVELTAAVVRWRGGMGHARVSARPFIHEGVPYLLKAASDAGAISAHVPGIEAALGVVGSLERCPALLPDHVFEVGADPQAADAADPDFGLYTHESVAPRAGGGPSGGGARASGALAGAGAEAQASEAARLARAAATRAQSLGGGAAAVGLVGVERARDALRVLAQEEAAYGTASVLVVDPASLDLEAPQLVPFAALVERAEARGEPPPPLPRALFPVGTSAPAGSLADSRAQSRGAGNGFGASISGAFSAGDPAASGHVGLESVDGVRGASFIPGRGPGGGAGGDHRGAEGHGEAVAGPLRSRAPTFSWADDGVASAGQFSPASSAVGRTAEMGLSSIVGEGGADGSPFVDRDHDRDSEGEGEAGGFASTDRSADADADADAGVGVGGGASSLRLASLEDLSAADAGRLRVAAAAEAARVIRPLGAADVVCGPVPSPDEPAAPRADHEGDGAETPRGGPAAHHSGLPSSGPGGRQPGTGAELAGAGAAGADLSSGRTVKGIALDPVLPPPAGAYDWRVAFSRYGRSVFSADVGARRAARLQRAEALRRRRAGLVRGVAEAEPPEEDRAVAARRREVSDAAAAEEAARPWRRGKPPPRVGLPPFTPATVQALEVALDRTRETLAARRAAAAAAAAAAAGAGAPGAAAAQEGGAGPEGSFARAAGLDRAAVSMAAAKQAAVSGSLEEAEEAMAAADGARSWQLAVPATLPLPSALPLELPGRRREVGVTMDPAEAATAIQAAARGVLVRKRCALLRRRVLERAVTMQRLWRAHVARLFAAVLRRRTIAAIAIQALQRGRVGRNRARDARYALAREWAATQVQRVLRGFLGRRRARYRRALAASAALCQEAAAAVTAPGLRALAALPAPSPELLAVVQVLALLAAPVRPLLAETGASSGAIAAPYDPVSRKLVLAGPGGAATLVGVTEGRGIGVERAGLRGRGPRRERAGAG